jgi:hypothetical protein
MSGNEHKMRAQKLPESPYPRDIWFAALNAAREIVTHKSGAKPIADAILAERQLRQREVAKAEGDYTAGFDAYMEALKEADKWHAYVGVLLGLIEWFPEWEETIVDNEEDRAAYDEINAEYEAKAKENAADARAAKQAIADAKLRVAQMPILEALKNTGE